MRGRAKNAVEWAYVASVLQSFDWYDELKELVYRCNNRGMAKRILEGVFGRHTILYAFPFKDWKKSEREKWIDRHNEFYRIMCYNGAPPTLDEQIAKWAKVYARREAREKRKKKNETLDK
jgi:hypothetical protein